MSDEKRREELKAIINEQLDKLSIEELERVAGGGGTDVPTCCPKCGSDNTAFTISAGVTRCFDCGYGTNLGQCCPKCQSVNVKVKQKFFPFGVYVAECFDCGYKHQ